MSDRESALALIPVSRETIERLDAYVALLRKWQATTNLVSPSTLGSLWTRHVADSLQLTQLAPRADHWLDIGSGGGFPGIVIACVLAERTQRSIALVERNAKKAAFLREALRVTGATGTVYLGDIADCAKNIPAAIDMVTARAVAPLATLLQMAEPWLSRGSNALFPKGQDVELELQETTTSGTYTYVLHPSLTGDGRIVEVRPRHQPTKP